MPPGSLLRTVGLGVAIVVVAAALWLLGAGWPVVVLVMALATAIAWALEWLGWRQARTAWPTVQPRPERAQTSPRVAENAPGAEVAPPRPVPLPAAPVFVGAREPGRREGGDTRDRGRERSQLGAASAERSEPRKEGRDKSPEPPSSWLRSVFRRRARPASSVPDGPESRPAAAPAPEAARRSEPETASDAGPAGDEPAPSREVSDPVVERDEEAHVEAPSGNGDPDPVASEARGAREPVEPPRDSDPEPRELPPRAVEHSASSTPPPAREREPIAAAEPPGGSEQAPRAVALSTRRGEPREWNLWDLERVARDEGRRSPERTQEWTFLFLHLREFADAGGTLPREFDGLVRESFPDLLARVEQA